LGVGWWLVDAKGFLYLLVVVEVVLYALDFLIGLVALACYEYHIAGLGQHGGCAYGLTTVDNAELVSFCGKYKTQAGWIVFVLVTIFVITAVSNGANLNDGMDGMAAGNSAIIFIALGILAYVSSHIEFASYLNIMYVPGSQELVIFTCATVGALIGFLWYNAYPAQIFMGDTGSLAIGGIIAVLAIIIHKELLIPILCGIFLLESLSVILQVEWYKLGKRKGVKQRIFKRTPIHDNFRVLPSQLDPECKYLCKWPHGAWHESKITIRFWITTIILAALTIITLKIR
jgi:phospho-N-acetylmuramoyl-pentapeptide-transferase